MERRFSFQLSYNSDRPTLDCTKVMTNTSASLEAGVGFEVPCSQLLNSDQTPPPKDHAANFTWGGMDNGKEMVKVEFSRLDSASRMVLRREYGNFTLAKKDFVWKTLDLGVVVGDTAIQTTVEVYVGPSAFPVAMKRTV